MKYAAVTAIALFVILSAVALPFSDDGNEADIPLGASVTVSGIVVSGYDKDGATDLPGGVTVQVMKKLAGPGWEESGSGNVGSDGSYSVTITDATSGIYEIRFTPVMSEEYGFLPLSHDVALVKDADGRYIMTLTGTESDIVVDAIMVRAIGTITGVVMNKGSPAGGVSVQVTDPNGRVVGGGRTDGAGVYSIECPVGDNYTVAVNAPYFKEASYFPVNLGVGDKIVRDFDVEVTETATYLFNLDFTHSLMLIGGILGLFLFIFVISYRIHIGKHPDASRIHSDTKKKDQE